MYHYERCHVALRVVGNWVLYVIRRENGQTGVYLREMVDDQRPPSTNSDGSPGPPVDGHYLVAFRPNHLTVFHPAAEPRLAADDSDDLDPPPAPRGMPFIGQLYAFGFRVPIPELRLDPFQALNARQGQMACPYAAAAAAVPAAAPPPPRVLEGNPCRELVDASGRPLVSLSFPVPGGLVARHGNTEFRFAQGRMEAEQALVSAPYNHVNRHGKVHASHLARHGHCGSPWRTNLTPTSALCNTTLVGAFEGFVMEQMQACYAAEADLADPAQDVLVYTVECHYNPAWALLWLAGVEGYHQIQVVGERSRRAQALRLLAHYLPVCEIRQMRRRHRGEWRLLYTQCHDLQAIMVQGGSPVDPRYRLAELDDAWGDAVLAWFDRHQFRLGCDPALAARNEALFQELAACTGFADWPRIGGTPASEYLARVQQQADRDIPHIDRGVQAVVRLIDLASGRHMTDQEWERHAGPIALQVYGLDLSEQQKDQLIARLYARRGQ